MILTLRSLVLAGLVLIPLCCATALAADVPATVDVDALHRGHSPADDPRRMDVAVTTEAGTMQMLADIENARETDAERDGQPARAWSADMRMTAVDEDFPPMLMAMVEYTGLDGRRLGSTSRHADGATTENIIVRSHPLPTAARPGDSGPMYEGTETHHNAEGGIQAQFFDERWSLHPAVDGEPRLHFTRRELDSSQQVRNEVTTEYAVTAEGRLRMLVARGREVAGRRLDMVFTPR